MRLATHCFPRIEPMWNFTVLAGAESTMCLIARPGLDEPHRVYPEA